MSIKQVPKEYVQTAKGPDIANTCRFVFLREGVQISIGTLDILIEDIRGFI
jgi:hypothetical protein